MNNTCFCFHCIIGSDTIIISLEVQRNISIITLDLYLLNRGTSAPLSCQMQHTQPHNATETFWLNFRHFFPFVQIKEGQNDLLTVPGKLHANSILYSLM